MKNKIFLFFLILSIIPVVCGDRILFYEVGASGEYSVQNGYSSFAQSLRAEGFDIATITKGELTKTTLESYDILVVQNLNKKLTTQEISSILWFVLQNGKGLFINGDGNGNANQLTVPFGVTVDGGMLIDTTDPIPNRDSLNIFTLDRFNDDRDLNDLRNQVSKIGFYKGSGFILSGDARGFLRGDSDTYSDTGSFPSGSQPNVAAATILGNGMVFVYSDADMLSNKNIDEYHNRRLGVNIINWLRSRSSLPEDRDSLQELKVIWGELNIQIGWLEKRREELELTKADLLATNSDLTFQLQEVQGKVAAIESTLIGPFTKFNWAFIILSVSMLGMAIVINKKQAKPKKQKDIGDLAYQMGGGDKQDDLDLGEPSSDDFEDIDDLDF